MVTRAGGAAHLLGIARDDREALAAKVAQAAGADVLADDRRRLGGGARSRRPGAAAGGHGHGFLEDRHAPGQAALFGRLGAQRVIGVPGNPVSALICARVFLIPLLRRLLVLLVDNNRPEPAVSTPPSKRTARAPTTCERAYRARRLPNLPRDRLADLRDSSLLAPLAEADCLPVRPAHAPAAPAGAPVEIPPIDF